MRLEYKASNERLLAIEEANVASKERQLASEEAREQAAAMVADRAFALEVAKASGNKELILEMAKKYM